MGSTGGWNRPSANQPTAKKGGAKMPSAMKGVVAGLVTVCALGGLCLWMFSGGENAHKDVPASVQGRIKAVKPAQARKSVSAKHSETRDVVKNRRKEDTPDTQDATEAIAIETNVTAVGTNKVDKRPFKSKTEVLLNMAIPPHPGRRVAPVPFPVDRQYRNAEEAKAEIADIEKGFDNLLKIEDGDTERMIERKELVAAAKEELREVMRQGGTLRDYLGALQEKFKDDADFLKQAQNMVTENYNDKTLTDAEYSQLKGKVDKMLEDRGLPATEDENTLAAKEAEAELSEQEKQEKSK